MSGRTCQRFTRIRSRAAIALSALLLAVAACGEAAEDVASPDDGDEAASDEAPEADADDEGVSSDASPDTDPITFAAPIAMSGGTAIYGDWQRPAIDMAVQDINEAGGVLGRPLEVIYEDVGADPSAGAAAVQRALARDPVAVYGMLFSFSVRAVAEIADDAGIPFLIAAQEWNLSASQEGSEWFWRVRAHDRQLAAVMADWIDSEGFDVVGFQHASDPMNTSTVQQMAAALEDRGIDVAGIEVHDLGDSDFTAQTRNIIQLAPELNVVHSYSAEAATVARQQKELGLDAPTFWGPAMYFAVFDFGMVDLEMVEGDYIALETVPPFSDDPAQVEWSERFLEESGLTANEVALSAYWGVFVLADAIERAGTTDPEALAAALDETEGLTEFNGIKFPGGPVTCDEHQNCLHNRVLAQFTSDGLEVVETYVEFTAD